MKAPRFPIVCCLLALVASFSTLQAQDFAELWLLGDAENGNQSEFSQERGNNGEPGSPDEQDDDFYFAGTYPDPIGTVATDEIFANYDRALTPGDAFNRIHFMLDSVAASPGSQLRFTTNLVQLGAAAGIDPITHDLVFRFNGREFHSIDDIQEPTLVEETRSAQALGARDGANTIEIERVGGSDSSWIQFDYLRLEVGASDLDGDGLPDTFEEQFAFLDPNNNADGAADQDGDGLTNTEEFQARTDLEKADTDDDTLDDADELQRGTNPLLADTDQDGLNDAAEVNTNNTDPVNPDTDGDGLTDGDEVNTHNTNPTLADTDTDGVDDATEIELETDPTDANDIPVLFSDLWQLGIDDGGQGEFTQEQGGSPEAPGSATELDDDYYFAGEYPDPIGTVAEDEPTANFERALTSGNTFSRIHFNLDDVQTGEGSEYKITLDLCCLGAQGDESVHDLLVRWNDVEIFSQEGIADDQVVSFFADGTAVNAEPGANTIEIERTGGSDGAWIQFDRITTEFRSDDTDRDRLPNAYEAKFAFLDPNDPSDAAQDEDEDGLTNLQEFEEGTEPDQNDTDQDGLLDGPEIEAGTRPRVADSDRDGLLDGAEVNTHQTDPLNPDTDGDGLRDGGEIAAGSSPLDVDTDGDGENDNDEVLYGSSPTDPNSTPLPYEQLWQIGEENGNQSEFTQEAGGAQPGPGSAEALDDDYYLAGEYPDPIGVVTDDEDWSFFERALTSGDPFSRIHFNLTPEQASPASQIRLTFEMVQLGAAGGIDSIHDLVVRVNGTEIGSRSSVAEATTIQQAFLVPEVEAVAGPNVIEIERTGQSPSSWIQFDYVRAEIREILTDNPNLRVQTSGVFGELVGLGSRTVTLEIVNSGEDQTLEITGAEITGPDRDHYSVGAVPATIAPGETASVDVTFDPNGRAGGFTAFLEFASNDENDPIVSVDLSALIPNANGLVAHYPMDETEGDSLLDTSGRGRHAELRITGEGSESLLGQPGLAGGTAVRFQRGDTGAAFAEITDTFEPFVDATFSMWFQADEGGADVFTLLSKNLPESQGDPFALAVSDGTFFVFAGEETDPAIGGITAGEPHHVVVVFQNADLENRSIVVYLDGEEAGRAEGVNGFDDASATPLVIGALGGSFGFNGVIDDLQVYELALSAEDVAFLNANPGQVLPGETPEDPNLDSDNDGQSDAAEAIAGTDPNDPNSVFALTSALRTGDGVELTWSSVDGKEYVIEYSTTLEPDSWVEVSAEAATGASTSFTDNDAARTGEPNGYYRVRVP